MKTLNVAIIGTKFMGKAHSNAWANAPRFFDMGIRPVLKVAVGTDQGGAQQLADTWGWEEASTDWQAVVARPDIDIVDISTPTYLHCDMAVAAAEAGKHVFLEKPFALSVAEAKRMVAAVEKTDVVHYVNHNYRRAPAVRLAKRLIDDGFIGRLFHWRSAYLQD
nr:Gfo/Idh/MocA family oxidoreductase [Promineifilum sp.]